MGSIHPPPQMSDFAESFRGKAELAGCVLFARRERIRPEIIRPQTIKEGRDWHRMASLFSTFNVLISQFLRGEEMENGE